MRKLLSALLALMLLIPSALAVEAPDGEIINIASGDSITVYGNDYPVTYEFIKDEYGDITKVSLTVGSSTVEYVGCYLEETVYASKLDGYETYLMVYDYGPSDDPWTEIFYFDSYQGALVDAGGVASSPKNMTVNPDGTFSGKVRANALYTWNRGADFVIAKASLYDEEYNYVPTAPVVIEAPRERYVMGAIAFPRLDVPLYADTTFTTVACTAKAGEALYFVSSDDATWVYCQFKAEEYGYRGGYLKLDSENSLGAVIIGGQSVNGYDAFPGLLYAD